MALSHNVLTTLGDTDYFDDEARVNGIWNGLFVIYFPPAAPFVINPEGIADRGTSRLRADLLVCQLNTSNTPAASYQIPPVLKFEGKSGTSGDTMDNVTGANPGAKSHLVENAKLGKIYDVIDDYALLTDALSWMAAHPFPSSVSLE
ncbi:MAG: hypothetical protein M1813_005967 [Trichoglossum hirsutum]|nr:MAG: hypothetical protein M1813_005967 [Trichoglossum hirsutum]